MPFFCARADGKETISESRFRPPEPKGSFQRSLTANHDMTLRARLGWGLFAIAAVLTAPLLISLRSLEHLYETSRLLRDREFAASMLLGSFRERTDDARRAEDALLFIHDEKSAARMQSQIDSLVSMTDSLERYRLDLSASQIRSSIVPSRGCGRTSHQMYV